MPDAGERSIKRSVLRNDRLIFTTFIPNVQICNNSAASWLMELNAFTGARLDFPPFDLNADQGFDDQDRVSFNDGSSTLLVSPSGLPSPVGALSTPAILWSGAVEYKYSSGSSGGIYTTTEHPGPGSKGRQAWRTLP